MFKILAWELRQRRWAIMWWTISSIILSVVIVLLYPSIRDQAKQLNQVINQLPPGLRELKSGGSGNVNVADPIAFLNSQLYYATLPILWIILAITRGSGILGRDEQNHTLELLLSRPISRTQLWLGKLMSLIVELAVVGLGSLLAVIVAVGGVNMDVGSSHLLVVTIYTALFALSFGCVAFTLQAIGGVGRHLAVPAAVLLGFGGYILASLSGLTDWLATPAKFAPYHYFAPQTVLHGQPVHGLNAYLIGVLVLTVIGSYLGFRRRDIT